MTWKNGMIICSEIAVFYSTYCRTVVKWYGPEKLEWNFLRVADVAFREARVVVLEPMWESLTVLVVRVRVPAFPTPRDVSMPERKALVAYLDLTVPSLPVRLPLCCTNITHATNYFSCCNPFSINSLVTRRYNNN